MNITTKNFFLSPLVPEIIAGKSTKYCLTGLVDFTGVFEYVVGSTETRYVHKSTAVAPHLLSLVTQLKVYEIMTV